MTNSVFPPYTSKALDTKAWLWDLAWFAPIYGGFSLYQSIFSVSVGELIFQCVLKSKLNFTSAELLKATGCGVLALTPLFYVKNIYHRPDGGFVYKNDNPVSQLTDLIGGTALATAVGGFLGFMPRAAIPSAAMVSAGGSAVSLVGAIGAQAAYNYWTAKPRP